MPRVLICTRKNRTPDEARASRLAYEFAVGKGTDAVVDDRYDWRQIQAENGGYRGAYDWAGRAHDAIILIESPEVALGRGQYEIAAAALRHNKRVYVWRDGALSRVRALSPLECADWKAAYAEVELESPGA